MRDAIEYHAVKSRCAVPRGEWKARSAQPVPETEATCVVSPFSLVTCVELAVLPCQAACKRGGHAELGTRKLAERLKSWFLRCCSQLLCAAVGAAVGAARSQNDPCPCPVFELQRQLSYLVIISKHSEHASTSYNAVLRCSIHRLRSASRVRQSFVGE